MILNLTWLEATPEQMAAGVVEPGAGDKRDIRGLYQFSELPSRADIVTRATGLANIARATGHRKVLIGDVPYLLSALEYALREANITPYYAFTRRKETKTEAPPGGFARTDVEFIHEGWIEGGRYVWARRGC